MPTNTVAQAVGRLTAQWKGTLVDLLGIEFVELTPERVLATLAIRDDLRTVGGALHGGTLMAFADTLGAVATVLNLPAGAGTTTLESKTNFFAAGRSGTVRAKAAVTRLERRDGACAFVGRSRVRAALRRKRPTLQRRWLRGERTALHEDGGAAA